MGKHNGVSHRSRRPCGSPQGEVGAIVAVNKIAEVRLDKYLSNSYEDVGANQAVMAVAREQCRRQTMQEAAEQAHSYRRCRWIARSAATSLNVAPAATRLTAACLNSAVTLKRRFISS